MKQSTKEGLEGVRDHFASQARAAATALEHASVEALEEGAAAMRATVRRTCEQVGVDPDDDSAYQAMLGILGMVSMEGSDGPT